MNKLFENLLISSPNGGGLFFVSDANIHRLDNINTTGLYCHEGKILRGIQPNSFLSCLNPRIHLENDAIGFGDIHDVLFANESIYLVSTLSNEIIQISLEGKEIKRWKFPGENDSWHINCICNWNGRIVFSAFGDFQLHREYKGKTKKMGFVQDLLSGERVIQKLSQPHSIVQGDDKLYLADSESGNLLEYNREGGLLRSKYLDGYTRGIYLSNEILYVGLSCSRNAEFPQLKLASVVAINRNTFEEIDRIELPVSEIYGIQAIERQVNLVSILASIASTASEVRSFEIHRRDQKIQELNVLLAEKVQVEAEIAAVKTHLNQIITSRSFKWTKPLRFIARLARKWSIYR